jgi:hypothetical protein
MTTILRTKPVVLPGQFYVAKDAVSREGVRVLRGDIGKVVSKTQATFAERTLTFDAIRSA